METPTFFSIFRGGAGCPERSIEREKSPRTFYKKEIREGQYGEI